MERLLAFNKGKIPVRINKENNPFILNLIAIAIEKCKKNNEELYFCRRQEDKVGKISLEFGIFLEKWD